jgi:hypothetical protein
MSSSNFEHLAVVASAVFACATAFGQVDLQLRPRQMPGWDARARDGRCEIRVWVDNRAEVRMRGDTIFVRTLEGSKSRDEGSQCSQPIPYNSLGEFKVRQTGGRSQVTLAQQPARMNNYTATITIEDRQGGGDNYAFEVSWRSEGDGKNAPAPFFDDVRACQDMVRQRFLGQNGRGSYIDFENFADRQGQSQNPGRGPGSYKGVNRGQETIQGRGSARSYSESRDLTYACAVDTQRGQVVSADYHFSGGSLRTNGRTLLK